MSESTVVMKYLRGEKSYESEGVSDTLTKILRGENVSERASSHGTPPRRERTRESTILTYERV